jgi:hypothetical protein
MVQTFLYCGLISSIWYIIINIVVPYWYPGYNIQTQTVSELSAIDSPSRSLWVALCIPFTIMFIAFGIGVWASAGNRRVFRIIGALLIADAMLGIFWPPMHRREVIAAGGGTMTDTLHLVWTYVHLAFILIIIILAAINLNRRFQVYSILTILIFIVFGVLTSIEAPGLQKNEPTPYIGIWERVNMLAYMTWISVFGLVLLKGGQLKNRIFG